MKNLPSLLPTTLLALALIAPAAFAQRPQLEPAAADKPWPQVAFKEVFDGVSIPTFGHTRQESGDIFTDMRGAGDGSGRIFLTERLGKILIMKDGKLLPEPFLDITPQATDQEHGLLSLAFPPGFKTKGYFYTYRTEYRIGDVLLERYKVDPKNPNHALADSAEVILRVEHRQFPNHNGGQLQFGPDGMLYFGIGDGGAAYDPNLNGQNLGVFLAKIIRVDVEGKPDTGKPYHVPSDNPFVKTPGALGEIWAFGVRNPWRFSFDYTTGEMYIGNVGQDLWEQIYFAPKGSKGGENYGWSIYEGTHNDSPGLHRGQKKPTSADITFPVAEFGHSGPQRFTSITGGYVYRGKEYPDWQGIYFFSDWGNAHLYAMRRNADGVWETHRVDNHNVPSERIISFGTDDDGNLYVLSFDDGKIYKLIAQPAAK